MSTTVSQTYTPALNVSVTKKDGMLVSLTTWVSGDVATNTARTYAEGHAPRVRTPKAKPLTEHQKRVVTARESLATYGVPVTECKVRIARDVKVKHNCTLREAVDALNVLLTEQGFQRVGGFPLVTE